MRFALFLALLFSPAIATAAPPVPPVDPAGLSGPLVIAGGGKINSDVRDAFFALAGKEKAEPGARIIVIPTAGSDADDATKAADHLKPWKDLGPRSLEILHTRDRKKADDPAFVKPLTEATGVWFSGGDPLRLIEAYRGTLVEKELKKLHARGGVIGGAAAGAAVLGDLLVEPGAKSTDRAFGFLPGCIIDPPGKKRLAEVIAANPSWVGLEIDDRTALLVRERTARVIGEGNVTIHVAAGAGHAAAADPHPVGSLLDIVQLRRAALNRGSWDPFPPARPADPVVRKGHLVIVGGGAAGPAIWKRFIELSGGPDALIVIIPSGMEDPVAAESVEEKNVKKNGARNVRRLHTRNPHEADDPKFSEILTKAGGVWFSGGRQWRFVDAYGGTLTEKRFHEVLERGGVIGGSSAGASIQSEYMPRGHPLGNTVMAAEGYEHGFGFLPGCAVDQHFFARKRTGDMTRLMKLHPQFLGIGIDEGTAIVVSGSTAEVIGKSKVAFYDARKKAAGDMDYEEVQAGEKYDLKARQKLK
jgi:cyanophycinase